MVRFLTKTITAVILFGILISCNLRLDLPPCPIYVGFDYNYNMAFKNLFDKQVKQVNLYVFDEEGKFVGTYTEQREEVLPEDFRMKLDLLPGKYKFLVWGGLDNFYGHIALTPGVSTLKDMMLMVNQNRSTIINKELSPLFYGFLDDVEVVGDYQKEVIVPLMKNTNIIRLVMKGVGPNAPEIDVNDYTFQLFSANGKYDYQNNFLPDEELSFEPYHTENHPQVGAIIELNTLRLFEKGLNYRLLIKEKNNPNNVLLDVNIIDYLASTNIQMYKTMATQEYLDRQDVFSIIFFFNQPVTAQAFLMVDVMMNEWFVRQQEIEKL